jgi:hypothetical protein
MVGMPMKEKDRIDGFKALLASHKSNTYYLTDPDGNHLLWDELSAEARLECIASDAAYCDVPFEPFAEAARESVGPDHPSRQETLRAAKPTPAGWCPTPSCCATRRKGFCPTNGLHKWMGCDI